jgi:hypothetical protein
MTRDEFLAFAKQRAHEYVDGREPHLALTSLIDDFNKRPDTADAAETAVKLGMPLLLSGNLDDPAAFHRFIDKFS